MTAVFRWLAEPLPHDVAQAIDRLASSRGVHHVAVMPDVHLADGVCVGTVAGTEDWLYPQAVGGDVGCGMAALRLAADVTVLADPDRARSLFAALRRRVPAVRQPSPQHVDLDGLSDDALRRRVQRDARIEFGTLGRGNHFLELQADEHDGLWLMVHSGSRALGPAVQQHHLQRAERAGGGLFALPAAGPGAAWLRDVDVAVDYARGNRRAIAAAAAQSIAEVLDAACDWSSWFDTTHNFVRRERHLDRDLWVHRKGACSARDGEAAIVPGSMGTASFHVVGRGEATALCSCSHGAGRRLPRGVALRSVSLRDLEGGMRGVFFERELAQHLRDEAPDAYKNIGAVMRAQRELVRVQRRLRPVLAYKGV